MKKRILISSVLTIVLCFSLIVGSTFALFTAEDNFDISITSGKVEINAELSDIVLYSAQPQDGYVIDDIHNIDYTKFASVQREDLANTPDVLENYYFANGGSAGLNGNVLTLTNVTPGDKVVFNIKIDTANTNVAIQYRCRIVADGGTLANAMTVEVDGVDVPNNGDVYNSGWTDVDVSGLGNLGSIAVSIELPVDIGNDYQGQKVQGQNVVYHIFVEAVQANGTN